MVHKKYLFTLLFIFALGLQPLAHSTTNNQCPEALSTQQFPPRYVQKPKPQTVFITHKKSLKGDNSGSVYTLLANSKSEWQSKYNINGFDFQGSPNLAVEVLGSALSRFLHIRLVN